MSFFQTDLFPLPIPQDSWQSPEDLVSAESWMQGTSEAELLDPSIMDPRQNPYWSFSANGVPLSKDLPFHNFGQEQYAVGNRGESSSMLQFQGGMMAPSQGFQEQRPIPACSDEAGEIRKRSSRNSSKISGARPQKRKRIEFRNPAYASHELSQASRDFQDGTVCDEDCNSEAGSATTCCSSCSEGPPCEDPHCAIPCAEPSCEIPICAEDCPEVCPGTSAQEMQFQQGFVPSSGRISFLRQSNGDLPSPAAPGRILPATEVYRDINPSRPDVQSDSQYQQDPESSSPPTPSMVQNMATPYSPGASLQTPQFLEQGSYSNEMNSTAGTGEMFPSPMGEWSSDDFALSGNAAWMFNCPWDECNAAIPDEQFWVQHLHQEHLDPQYNYGCPLQSNDCPTTLANPLNHLQTQHGFDMNESFSCPAPTCSPAETYNDPAMFHNHFDLAHATPAQGFLHCRLNSCNNSFVDPNQLLSHIHETHQLPIPPPKVAAITDAAKYPTIIAESEDLVAHTCKWKLDGDSVCGETCGTEEDLQNHVKAKHLASLSKSTGYICQWENCNRPAKMGSKQGFSQRGKLERHMASHTNFKCSKCDICGQMFSAEQAMKQHRLLHTGQKPWKCKHCDKRFPQQSACTIHERTHTKEKPLVCEICNKRFSESSNFAKHRRTHGEMGKHACGYPGCVKTFHRSDQLKKHLKMHSKMDGGSGKREDASSDEASDDESFG